MVGGWERGISGKVNFNSIVEPVCTEEILYKAGRRIVQPCGMMLVMKQISVHRRNRRCHSGVHSLFILSQNVSCVQVLVEALKAFCTFPV